MKKFSGLFTAIVTPFTDSGELDKQNFLQLLEYQISTGIDGIVVCGSTGEGATLSTDEKCQLWEWATEHTNGRVPIIAGTGLNDTRATIELTKKAKAIGVDAVLLVTPYYNKPTQAGCIAHHRAIADAVDISQILYNVPSRTGTTMLADTQLTIAEHCKNVIGTKEATANLELMSEIIRNAPEHFAVIAGDDSLALPIISLGATGCIAVVSNYAPIMFSALIHESLNKNFERARELQKRLMDAYKINFIESNPIPVKHIMYKLGLLTRLEYRLPLTPLSTASAQRVDAFADVFADVL